MYHIQGLCPIREMGGFGFNVQLWPEWKDCVSRSGLDQEKINGHIEHEGRHWLDICGYDADFDPDNCGAWRDSKKPLGPNARKMYEPRTSIRVSWGEWGPEHITVPGNACGLDIDRNGLSRPRRGAVLTPHNVDSWRQVQLLLIVFTQIADSVILFGKEE